MVAIARARTSTPTRSSRSTRRRDSCAGIASSCTTTSGTTICASPPALVTIRRDGREIPAVVALTKSGLMFVLDRRTGEPLFPIEERPMPASHVPGEQAWPTQPYPAEARAAVATHRDHRGRPHRRHAGVARVLHAAVRAVREQRRRIHRRPTRCSACGFPARSAARRGRACRSIRRSGTAFVNVNEIGAMGLIRRRAAGAPAPAWERWSPGGGLRAVLGRYDLPCQRPPWGKLHAIDLATGEFRVDGAARRERQPARARRRQDGRAEHRRLDRDGGRARVHRQHERQAVPRVRRRAPATSCG